MNETVDNCHACGTPLIPDAAYCHRCGSPALLPAVEEAPPAPPQAEDLHQPSIAPGTLWSAPAAGGGAFGTPPASGPPAPGAVPPSGGAFPLPPYPPPPSPPPPAPAPPPGAPDDGLARALGGGYTMQMGEWLSRGWSVFTREGGLFLAFSAIGWVYWAVTFSAHALPPLSFAMQLLGGLVVMPLLSAGFMTAALVARRGERLQFSDFWLPFQDFLPLLLANLVAWALLFAGLCTCGAVTIYLWVAYQFASLLILDRRMDFWDALECSRKASTKQWFGIFAFSLLLFLINLAGLAMCCVGIIVTFPLTVCALVEAYADIFGVRGGLPAGRAPSMAAPPAPPPAV